ncbi:MAG: undecaprenyldiphospho-muramoylpentapeptide beta-N-acetylglucosaminyltransferase [Bacilli bacterium]|nr:undecaprenyldiphospho-muramoylpentapeptide beta-N-acetylglucosaminyltransferase [Bacilli bacterium]
MKIIVSAGGSFGHINPALAIIRKFQEKEKDLEVLYIGTHNRMEKEIVPKENIPYEEIEIYGFTKNMKQNFKNLKCIRHSTQKCLQIMKDFQPDVVIGVGGYVTYPVLKAAHKQHIKIFLHEQNSIPGKSNKVLAKYADLIGVTFRHSIPYFKTKGRIIYTGHPCGAQALLEKKIDKCDLGLTKGKKLVIIVAGSLGSGSLNDKMKEVLLKCENENFEVLYITGKAHYESFMLNMNFPSNVFVKPYVDHLAGFLKNADVVISRAGAASLYELMALHIPSIIIPSPNVANNHQYYNAVEMQEKGVICMLEESRLTSDQILAEVKDLLENKERRFQMIERQKKMDVMDSSSIIYQEIKDMIK